DDNTGLDLYATDDNAGKHVTRVTARREEQRQLPLHELKVTRVRNRAMLNRLGKSRSQIVKWKGTKGLRVDHDGTRIMKNPHQILSHGGVDPRLAPNGGVD